MTRPEIRIGMRVSDNDYWYRGSRVMTIGAINGDYAQLVAGNHTTRILLRRIHTDGKPRKSGWSVVA